jgi:arylsulfatase A-like enzyme
MTDAAIRFIDEHQSEPFFLFLSYLEPHHQNTRDDYPAPPGYEERYRSPWVPPDLATLGGSAHYQLPGYYGMVKRLDECLGRLLDALYSLGLDGNTVVLFTSDHGNHFKTRNPEYKRSLHEASVRVPTAVQGPGFDGGGTVAKPFSLIDIPPTLLDAAGIAQKKEMMGSSVLPHVKDRNAPWQDDVYIEVSESELGRVVRTSRWKYGVVATDADPWNDPTADRYQEAYLFDLYADPYELVNLAGAREYREVSDRLKERLRARMAQTGEGDAEIKNAPEREVPGQRQVWPEELDQ